MDGFEIRRPRIDESEKLEDFFRIVIEDTFYHEGLSDLKDDIENEINTKINYLKEDLDSDGKKRYFLVAFKEDLIVGCIEFGMCDELIRTLTKDALKDLIEIGTVFVLPPYQGQGIGSYLLNHMLKTLENKGIHKYCLDSGYKKAQEIWTKKFGPPQYLFKDYWSSGNDHMIWVIEKNKGDNKNENRK